MSYLRQIERALDFIETNLGRDVQPAEVARHAGVSHWHFQRMFKALTRETLMGYIRARRLAHALDTLLAPDARIIEVALAAGFDSQEAFTRAFKQAFGTTPGAYRRRGRRFAFMRRLRIDGAYLDHLQHNLTLEPTLYDQAAMRLVGLPTHLYGADSEKNNLGDKLPPLWDAFLARLGEVEQAKAGVCYGVIRQTPAMDEELEYHACIEVTAQARVPTGMVAIEVPAARYARFTHRGLPAELDTTVSYIYASWLARSGMRHTYGPDLELYGGDYVPSSAQSIIRYAVPVAPADE